MKISEIRNNLNLLNEGLSFYNNSYTDTKALNAKIVYSIESTKLYQYTSSGQPILFIPSHINKSYILDFSERFSLIRKLANQGFMPFIIDWGDESFRQNLDFDNYLTQRLLPIVKYINYNHSRPILAGYCMGGLFTLALSQIYPNLVKAMIHISTPWNFHAYNRIKLESEVVDQHIAYLQKLPFISGNMIQMMFYQMYSKKINNKFLNNKYFNSKFIEIENWVNDGLNMSTPLFINIFKNFIINNLAFKNSWYVLDQNINPSLNIHRSLFIVARKDDVVPNTCALPLAMSLRLNTTKIVQSGHIGMMIDEKYELDKIIYNWAQQL